MLRSITELEGYRLDALDGKIGQCKDFLFDDQYWIVRYMVADTGRWLPGRKVLVPPTVFGDPKWATKAFPVELTKETIEASPRLDAHAPVSRQYEQLYYEHFGWPYYWAAAYAGHAGVYPAPLIEGAVMEASEGDGRHPVRQHPRDYFLRSVDEVTGYHIHATDGDIGHVEDFIVDDASWIIRYMIVDTRNWLPGRKVLVAPLWITRFDWPNRKVFVDLPRSRIENSPEYDPSEPVNREYEERLYNFYGAPVYWS